MINVIGLPTVLMFATNGVEVVGTDYNKELVSTLNDGKMTFKEDGMDELFEKALKSNITFTNSYQKADIYIVSVPTPYDIESKKIDAKYMISAVHSILDCCSKGQQ